MCNQVKVVGYAHTGYNQKRNIYGNKVSGFKFQQQKIDVFKVLDHTYYKIKHRTNLTYHNLHLGVNKCDLLHYFNGISLGHKPWIASFETSLPRVNHFYSSIQKKLSSSQCKHLIAISKCAFNIQSENLKSTSTDVRNLILNKTSILHPPQHPIIKSITEKPENKTLTLTIIGADFFRKGGLEILEAIEYLLDKKHELTLNIVSRMQFGDYASRTTKSDYDKALSIIKKYPNSIHHISQTSNDEVINLLKKSDVCLLPTYADTYGYSVLEAQACGCTVITTDIRALPEINSNEVGYLIKVPKDDLGNGKLNSSKERAIFSSIIKDNLIAILLDMIDKPKNVLNKGKLSLERIKTFHSPILFGEEMQKIYSKALNL